MRKNPGWTSTFASLQNRNFRLFSIGIFFSFTALQMQTLTLNYLVYQLTDSAKAIGYVNAGTGLCMLIFSFAGGLAADRLSKRNLMVATQTGISLITFALGLLISTKTVRMEYILSFAIFFGILSAVNMVARQSYLPDLVSTAYLTNASGLISGNMSLTRIIGPAVGGFLVGLYGAASPFYVKTLAHVLFITLLLFIPIKGMVSAPSASIIGDAIEGLRYLRRDRKVFDLLVLGTVPLVLGASYINYLPVFQKNVFHVGAAELGLMMSITGAGAIIGSLSIAALGEYRNKARIQFLAGIGFGGSLILFSVAAYAGHFLLSLVMLALVGTSGTAFVTLNNALVQTNTPPEMHGRVQGLFIAGLGLMSLGGLAMGMLVDAIGPSPTMAIFGGTILTFVASITFLRPDLRQL